MKQTFFAFSSKYCLEVFFHYPAGLQKVWNPRLASGRGAVTLMAQENTCTQSCSSLRHISIRPPLQALSQLFCRLWVCPGAFFSHSQWKSVRERLDRQDVRKHGGPSISERSRWVCKTSLPKKVIFKGIDFLYSPKVVRVCSLFLILLKVVLLCHWLWPT